MKTQPAQTHATHTPALRLMLASRSWNNESEAKGMAGCLADERGVVVCYFPDKRSIVKYCDVFAAAPDLLAALEFIVNDVPAPGENAELTVEGYNRACAEIARANGQA